MDIMKYAEYLVYVLNCATSGEAAAGLPKNLDEDVFLSFCAMHKLDNIVYLTIGDKLSDNTKKTLADRYNKYVYISAIQQYYLEQVETAFAENNIDYLLLKGREIVKLYPSEDMRQSADFDIYLGRKNCKIAKNIMTDLGFEIISYTDTDDHDEYIADKLAMCELHPVLIQNNHPWQEECNKIPERLVDGEKPHEKRMCNEDFYIYNLAHTAKHMKLAGIGIRAFLDMWLIYKKYRDSFDIAYLEEKLKLANLYEFHINTIKLCEYWFCNNEADDLIKAMATYVAESGWVGTVEQQKSTALAETAGSFNSKSATKIKKYMKMLFLPYEIMAEQYPILKKHKWLLPICYIYKAFRAMIKSRDIIVNVSKELEAGDMQTGKAIVELKTRVGL